MQMLMILEVDIILGVHKNHIKLLIMNADEKQKTD